MHNDSWNEKQTRREFANYVPCSHICSDGNSINMLWANWGLAFDDEISKILNLDIKRGKTGNVTGFYWLYWTNLNYSISEDPVFQGAFLFPIIQCYYWILIWMHWNLLQTKSVCAFKLNFSIFDLKVTAEVYVNFEFSLLNN